MMAHSCDYPIIKTELLAPAGSIEAFFAALEHGADAVYCGLDHFSARAKAKNFSLQEMEGLAAYANSKHKRLYVALNTLIQEKELSRVVDMLAALYAMHVDGIILQDLGVWRLARRLFPKLALHASTQMTVHNRAGVIMLEKMGFTRAVLARELTLDEIAEIRRTTTIELEQFVHGALCFSISGQCLFSSYLTGMSGNRGRCAQPCRRRYHDGRKEGYFFSTSDLCAIGLLPRLIQAGIMSFKIEGRMKSADYVARVVKAYRTVLDASPKEHEQAVASAHEQLELSFGRRCSKGFLSGFLPSSIVEPHQHGGLGKKIGEIASVRSGLIGFTTNDRLHRGDRIRIQPTNDQVGTGFTVRRLFINDKEAKSAVAGEFVRLERPKNIHCAPGDTVFKLGGKALFTRSRENCLAMLEDARRFIPATPLSCSSQIPWRSERDHGAAPLQAGVDHNLEKPSLTLLVRSCEELSAADEFGAQQLELPLTPHNVNQLKTRERQIEPLKGKIIWQLPPLLFGHQWQDFRRAVQMLHGQGFRLYRLQNLGHLPLFDQLEPVTLLGGFRCYVTNSEAAFAWSELGLSAATISMEDDRDNIKALCNLRLPLTLEMIVYGLLPIMLSRVPLQALRSAPLVRSEAGEGFRLKTENGITEVTAEREFSLLGRRKELYDMGCRRLLVDLRHVKLGSARAREIMQAFADEHERDNATSMNYERGLR